MSKVICPNCGSEVILPEHSEMCVGMTISQEGNSTYVLPMSAQKVDVKNKEMSSEKMSSEEKEKTMTKAEQRIETLKARGIDTSAYFSLTNDKGEGVLMKWENGVPVSVPMDSEDEILNAIIENGYVRNTKLHRRWVLAQMNHALNYAGYSYEKRNGKYFRTCVSGYEAFVKNKGYMYTFEMMLEEVRVLAKLEKLDKEAFEERAHFFSKKVVVSTCREYEKHLAKYVDGLKERHCKGVPYKRVNGYDFFVNDLGKKLYGPIESKLYFMEIAPNYERLYFELRNFVSVFVKRYKLDFNTPMAHEWKDAYKGSGAYYSLQNLVKYHGCFIIDENGNKLTGVAASTYISSFLDKYQGEGYRYFAMMKKVIADNNFDFSQRMRDLGVAGY